MKTLQLDPTKPDLYTQIEDAVGGRGKLYEAAKAADEFLCRLSNAPAVEQEDIVSRLGLGLLQKIDLEESLPTALLCASMVECRKRLRHQQLEVTSSQLVLLSLATLSEKYHSDW